MQKQYRAAGRYPGWRRRRILSGAPGASTNSNRSASPQYQTDLVRLLQDMAVAANESDSIAAALQFAVDRLCAFLQWPVGHALLLNEQGTLNSAKIWHSDLPDQYEPFRQHSESLQFGPGFGLPGEVLETRHAAWVENMPVNRVFQRHSSAAHAGLRTGLGVPVFAQQNVVAVLEFFHTQEIPADAGLLAVLPHIGIQLGRVIERQNAQASLRKTAAQLRLIITSLPMLLLVADRSGQVMMLEGKGVGQLNIPTSDVLGKSLFQWADQRPDIRALIERSLIGEEIHTEIQLPNQAIYDVFFSPYYSADWQVEGVIGLAFDVSDRKRLELDLEELKHLLLDSVEHERTRLGRQIHDGPLQDLFGVYYQVQEVQNLLVPEGQEIAERALNTLRDVNATLRVICGDLYPSTLTHLGIQRSIASYTDQLIDRYLASPDARVPEIHLDLAQTEIAMVYKQRVSLFRIYQNLLNNVLRHAQAQNVWVRLYEQNSAVHLEVFDDGKGFILPASWVDLVRQGHFGLANVVERVDGMEGTLQIQSAPGAGTQISLQLPLKPAG